MPRKKSATKVSASNGRSAPLSQALRWLKTSVWAFPVVLFVFVCILTSLRLSGTSVGIYHDTLYGETQEDPNLLYGEPRPIRSDEWLSTTQIITSQELNGLPRFNEDLGTGRDVSLQPEVPYLDWTTIFRPHTWSHIVLPLEFAFAFRWWFITYLVIIGCYLFTLYLLPNKKLIAILVSLAFGLSPFIHWWYQTAVSGTLAFGFMMLILSMKIIDNKRLLKKRPWLDNILTTGGLVFFMVAFGLILYPPFLIPVAIVILFFILGYLLNKKINESYAWKYILQKIGILSASAITAALIGVLFIFTRKDVINSITSTVYPGERIVVSGGEKLIKLFDGFVMPILQSASRGPNFLSNQSEASNFILLVPFLLIPGFIVIFMEYRTKNKINWLLFMVQVCLLMFIARIYVPIGDKLYELLLLNKVPHKRLVIGLGFAGIIQLVLMIKYFIDNHTPKIRKRLSASVLAYSLLCFVCVLYCARYIAQVYPDFISFDLQIIVFAFLFSLIIYFLLSKRIYISLAILLAFSLGSSFKINPMYQGLGFVGSSKVASRITQLSDEEDRWVTVDNIYFDSIAALGGRSSLTGVQIYPDTDFWDKVAGQEYNFNYNRQGHLVFTSDASINRPFNLVAGNYLQVKFSCSDFIKKEIQYAISTSPLEDSCLTNLEVVSYPKVTFYLYEIK